MGALLSKKLGNFTQSVFAKFLTPSCSVRWLEAWSIFSGKFLCKAWWPEDPKTVSASLIRQ